MWQRTLIDGDPVQARPKETTAKKFSAEGEQIQLQQWVHCPVRLRRQDSENPRQHDICKSMGAVFWLGRVKNPAFDPLELLKAGDVEANPGPRTAVARCAPEQKCESCGKAAPGGVTCAASGCNNISHKQKKCSGQSLTADRKWFCTEHGSIDDEEKCEWCEKRFSVRQKPLRCKQVGCKKTSHTYRRCSGISRYVKDPVWRCEEHGGRKLPTRTEVVVVKAKCAGCKKALCQDVHIKCESCSKRFHKVCTKTSRDEQERIVGGSLSWTCARCEKIMCAISSQDEPVPSFSDLQQVKTTKMRYARKDSLKILQWNADTLGTKVDQLRLRMEELDVDVALIQEAKLNRRATPVIKGYKEAMRADRIICEGGGLVCYIRDSLPFEKLHSRSRNATESTSFRIRMDKSTWVTITNVYVPPAHSKGQEIRFTPDAIPTHDSSIICGDFNGHSVLWDKIQPTDTRGEKVIDWILDNNLEVMNSGEETRHNKSVVEATGSTPDISLCGKAWHGKCTWSVGEDLGGSDHLPILVTLNNSVMHQSIHRKNARWKDKGVDWAKFTEALEELQSEINTQEGSMSSVVNQFTEMMTNAGIKHVGKSKQGKKTKPWMKPPIRAAIRRKNALRRNIKKERKEYLEACAELREMIKHAKEESWKEALGDAIDDADERKTWMFIKSLNGSPDNNSPNEVMKHNGEIIASNRKKADIFASHYARVSSHKFTKEERAVNLRFKKFMQSPTVQQPFAPFTMKELKSAIKRMKKKGAPGPDELPPTFFKALGPKALQTLLEIFNRSLEEGFCPQVWRNAIIIPLLKAGKSPSAIESFRPVSLTSCAVKIMERMVAERLTRLAEKLGLFNKLQAGFRKGRSCEDQILRIVQAIEDGFQQKKLHRSVLVLLDFSKAYDTVWRERLLLTMGERGIPLQLINWLKGFLHNRQANVKFCDAMSGTRTMKQGLPQGSVLSPILFVFYINELADILPESVLSTLFADDVGILATSRDREKAQQMAQEAVDVVVEWSGKWKLSLNATKSEVSYFSTWNKEADHKPSVMINGAPIPFKKTPRLLGVLLDRQLTFNAHVEHIKKEVTSKMGMLSALANTEYGWRKDDLKVVYNTFIHSRIHYAAAAWQPWLSDTNIGVLDALQNRALRIMSGQVSSTPKEALRAEMDMSSFATLRNRSCLLSREKAERLPEDHPRSLALRSGIPPRNERTSWLSRGAELTKLLPRDVSPRLPLQIPLADPWRLDNEFEVHPLLPGVSSRDDEEATKREAAIRRINNLNPDIMIYTDGSAAAGCRNGGSAVVITTGDAESPDVSEVIRRRGASHTSSYEEECQAMWDVTEWLKRQKWEEWQEQLKVVICTDSQSMCKALLEGSAELEEMTMALNSCPGQLIIQWIPGHSNIPGNEIADEEAKKATEEEEVGRPVSLAAVKPAIKSHVKDGAIVHQRTRQVYSCKSKQKDKLIRNRSEQVLLARVRSGHHPALGTYKHRLNPAEDPSCPRCMEADVDGSMPKPHALDNVEHLLECPGTAELRMRTFGRVDVGLGILTEDPRGSATLARRTLRGVGRGDITDVD